MNFPNIFVKIFVDKETSAIIDIVILPIIINDEVQKEISLKENMLGGDFRLSVGHGTKLDLGLILKRCEYEIVEVEHKQ